MENKIKKCISLIFFISAIFPLVIIGKCTTLYGDDFIYATYFLDGIENFFKMTYEHYMKMNGRALVHFLLEVILIFKDKLFFIVIPLLLTSVFVLYCKTDTFGERHNAFLYTALAILCTLSLSSDILREGLFWMSGAMNYVFPTFLALVAFLLEKKSVYTERFTPLYALIMFFCGASTEQGGAIAASFCILYIISQYINNKKASKTALILPLFIILGYMTVILSPSTSARTAAEAADNAIPLIKRLDNLFYISLGNGGALWVFELNLIMYALRFRKTFKPISLIACASVIASIVLSIYNLTMISGLFILSAYLYICAVLFFKEEYSDKAIVTFSAIVSVGMLIFSTTFGYRNIFPCLLLLVCVSVKLFLECLPKQPYRQVLSYLLVLFITASRIYPLAVGYAANRRLIDENLASVSNNGDGFYYNVDINPKYGYNQFISDNYYRTSFKKIYNINDTTKIYIKGKDFTNLTLNGIHLEYPMYTEKSTDYFPLRNVIEAYGGKIEFNEERNITVIDINDKKVYYDNKTKRFTFDENIVDASTLCAQNKKYGRFFEFNQYFTKDIYESVFSISL